MGGGEDVAKNLHTPAVRTGCFIGRQTLAAQALNVEASCPFRTGRPLAVACEQLIASLPLANTVFTSATSIAAGELKVANKAFRPTAKLCVQFAEPKFEAALVHVLLALVDTRVSPAARGPADE